jgi:hypothetical protein
MFTQRPGGSSSTSKSPGPGSANKSSSSQSGSPAVVDLDDAGYRLVQTLTDEQASHLS